MVKKINIKDISPAWKMYGWDLLIYIKKRKKTAITVIGSLLAYLITNNEIVAILAGGLFEMGISVIEYWLTNVEN